MTAATLRPYQSTAIDRIESELSAGRSSIIAVGPTGCGKGTLIAHIAAARALAGKRTMVVAHRREIVLDLRDRVLGLYSRVGAIVPGERMDQGAPVQVASTQSILGEEIGSYDLVIADECHHYAADEWRSLFDAFGDTPRVGFTATPQRSDGRAMGDIFESLIEIAKYSELIARGELVSCDVLRPSEYTGIDLAQHPVDAYLAHARGSSAFIFTRDVESANECVARLRAAGVQAATVHADTAARSRDGHLRDLESGAIQVIANAYTMTEGVDVPRVSTVVLARNAAYAGSYVQMTGRCLRPYPGKRRALVIDLHGVSHLETHGSPTADREWTLDGRGMPVGDGPSREYIAPRDAFVLDMPLELVAQRGPNSVPETPVDVSERRKKPLTKASFWARLMRDVKADKITEGDAQAAFIARFGRSARS